MTLFRNSLIHRYSQEIENAIGSCRCHESGGADLDHPLQAKLESLERLVKRHADAKESDYTTLVRPF